jgi:hypothetical protein
VALQPRGVLVQKNTEKKWIHKLFCIEFSRLATGYSFC